MLENGQAPHDRGIDDEQGLDATGRRLHGDHASP
jgi:hypothetical protein